MDGASSRRKGHNFERWVAKELTAVFGKAKREWQQQKDHKNPDVSCEMIPFFFECKRGKKTNIKAALQQAADNCPKLHMYPVAVTKDDRQQPMVTMYWNDWLAVVHAVWLSGLTDEQFEKEMDRLKDA